MRLFRPSRVDRRCACQCIVLVQALGQALACCIASQWCPVWFRLPWAGAYGAAKWPLHSRQGSCQECSAGEGCPVLVAGEADWLSACRHTHDRAGRPGGLPEQVRQEVLAHLQGPGHPAEGALPSLTCLCPFNIVLTGAVCQATCLHQDAAGVACCRLSMSQCAVVSGNGLQSTCCSCLRSQMRGSCKELIHAWQVFYRSNPAREAFVEMCESEYVQRMTFDSYLYKTVVPGVLTILHES